MRSTSRTMQGNITAFIIVAVLFIMLVAFFILNYAGLFVANKKAQSAIDAAALAAASKIASISVTFPTVGQIALVDQPPATAGAQPIRGINTALATARLDCLIGADLGNPTIVAAAQKDLTELQGFAVDFNAAVAAASAPQTGPVWQAAQAAYLANTRDPSTLDQGSLAISVGGLKTGSDILTNIPVPSSNSDHPDPGVQQINGLYKAYADSKVNDVAVVFAAVGKEISLVDNGQFSLVAPVDGVTPPSSVVKVEADSVTQNQAPSPDGTKTKNRIHNVACAIAGGPIQQNLSTVYTIGFAGGFPPPSAFGGTITVASLMNSTAWQPAPNQTWYSAPDDNTVPPASPMPVNFRGANGDNPSVALSYGVYDWMRSEGLRLDRLGAFSVLNNDLVAAANGGQSTSYLDHGSFFELPVYATNTSAAGTKQSSCLMQDVSNQDDPRCLTFATGGTDGATSIATAFGYKPAEVECPATTAATVIDAATGESKTTDGSPLANVCDFQNDLISTSHAINVVRNGMERALATAKLLADHLTQNRDGSYDKDGLIRWVENNNGDARGRKNEPYTSWTIGSPNQQMVLNYLREPGLNVNQYLTELKNNLPTNIHQLYIKRCASKLVGIVRALKVVSKDGLQELGPPSAPHTYEIAKKGRPIYYHFFPEVKVQGGQLIRGVDYHLFTDQQCEDAKNVLLNPHKQTIVSGGYYRGQQVQWTNPQGTTGTVHTYGAITAKDDGSEDTNAPTVATTGPIDSTDPADDEDGVDSNMPPTANTNTRYIYNLQISGNAGDSKTGGQVTLNFQNNGNPFSSNVLQAKQIHYSNCGALVLQVNGATTSWSVIARDQAANLSAGDTYSQQPGSSNWCNGFIASGPCPVSAGEWRIGCPLPASPMCCHEGKKIGYAYENPFVQPQIPPVADDVCPPIPYTLY